MELQRNQQGIFGKRKSHPGGVRWVKEWVPQDLACTGGKCCVLKWVREDVLQALKEQSEGQGGREPEPEPTTEILFLCSFEGCGKTFIDAGALRKHSHIHGERQYACHYEGCGKKFLDSSKLKRHFLIHTGQRDYICPHEGCGKAFSLDFNLRAHMRTHTQENYHLCPYEGCGKRFAHDYKLQAHIKANHEKISMMNTAKHALSIEKHHIMHSSPASNQGSGSSSRPYVCPYKGCGKDYIHEYKLNLHLRKEHSSPYFVESHKHASTAMFGNGLNVHDQDDFVTKVAINGTYKSSKHYLKSATTVLRKELAVPNLNVGKQWLARGQADSEETEGNGKIDDGWVYQKTNEYNEDTEDEE